LTKSHLRLWSDRYFNENMNVNRIGKWHSWFSQQRKQQCDTTVCFPP
jgi:hypothetical protein